MLPWIWLDVVRRSRHVVLEQRAALEHGDLGDAGVDGPSFRMLHVHAHQVATKGASLALAAAPGLEHVVVELERVVVDEQRLHWCRRAALAAAATLTTTLTATALTALGALATLSTTAAAAPAASSAAAPAPSGRPALAGLRLGLGVRRGPAVNRSSDAGRSRRGLRTSARSAALDRWATFVGPLGQLVGLALVGRSGSGTCSAAVAVATAA